MPGLCRKLISNGVAEDVDAFMLLVHQRHIREMAAQRWF
jgi:hypothetical protein